jgi:hypothetical protein
LAAIESIILKPQNAVDQFLGRRVKKDQRQGLGLNRNPKTEEIFCRPLKVPKGKSEVTPP